MALRHLVIHGRVQGVGFRASLAWEAQQLGVTGWVRNRCDGTVEALIQGDDEAVAGLLAWARQGPPGAQVSRVEVELGSGDFTGFEQKPTT
ncbi:MAG: acylphosphatase [Betaproteobacteria bacterium]|jgi:acylphosphatase|nr:acylphosphatase [Betaproteobacteria bacterium]